MEKVEELARTLDQLQRILSAYPEMMQSKEIQRLELIQRYVHSLCSQQDFAAHNHGEGYLKMQRLLFKLRIARAVSHVSFKDRTIKAS